jgi:hypothetical protein
MDHHHKIVTCTGADTKNIILLCFSKMSKTLVHINLKKVSLRGLEHNIFWSFLIYWDVVNTNQIYLLPWHLSPFDIHFHAMAIRVYLL